MDHLLSKEKRKSYIVLKDLEKKEGGLQEKCIRAYSSAG